MSVFCERADFMMGLRRDALAVFYENIAFITRVRRDAMTFSVKELIS
jgi:hypothetical protein